MSIATLSGFGWVWIVVVISALVIAAVLLGYRFVRPHKTVVMAREVPLSDPFEVLDVVDVDRTPSRHPPPPPPPSAWMRSVLRMLDDERS